MIYFTEYEYILNISVRDEIQYLKDLGFFTDSIMTNIFNYRELIVNNNSNIIDHEVNELKGSIFQSLSKIFIPIHDLHSLYAINRSNLVSNSNNLDILHDLMVNKEEVFCYY